MKCILSYSKEIVWKDFFLSTAWFFSFVPGLTKPLDGPLYDIVFISCDSIIMALIY